MESSSIPAYSRSELLSSSLMAGLSHSLHPTYSTSPFLVSSQLFHPLFLAFAASSYVILSLIIIVQFFFFTSLSISPLSPSGRCHAAVTTVYLTAVQSIHSPGFHPSLCAPAPAFPSLHHTEQFFPPCIIKGTVGRSMAPALQLLNHQSAVSACCSVGSDTSLLLAAYSMQRGTSSGCHSLPVMRGT